MLPLPDTGLRLDHIAQYWSRELQDVRTAAEIYNKLLSAFWQDRLASFGSSGETRVDRKRLLGAIAMQVNHPGFVIVESREAIPEATYHPDGTIKTIQINTPFGAAWGSIGVERRFNRGRV